VYSCFTLNPCYDVQTSLAKLYTPYGAATVLKGSNGYCGHACRFAEAALPCSQKAAGHWMMQRAESTPNPSYPFYVRSILIFLLLDLGRPHADPSGRAA
jgi:hypothetical protein